MSQSESEIESKCRQCRKIALKLKKASNGRPRDTPNKRNYCPFNLEHWYLHDVKGRLGTVDGKDIEVARQQQQLLHINTFTGCTRSKQKVPSYSTTLCRRCMLFPGSTTLGMSDFHNQSSTNSTNSKSGTCAASRVNQGPKWSWSTARKAARSASDQMGIALAAHNAELNVYQCL